MSQKIFVGFLAGATELGTILGLAFVAGCVDSSSNTLSQTRAEISAAVTPNHLSYGAGNVKRYGAIGNGLVDDTDAINAAILVASQSATENNSATVFLPSGIYRTSAPIRLREGVTLLGQGATYKTDAAYTGTVIMPLDSFNQPNGGIIESYNVQAGGLQEFANIEKIRIQGNQESGSVAGYGIYLKDVYVNSYLRDVTVANVSGVGVGLYGTANGGPIQIENYWINRTGSHGLLVDNAFQYVRLRDGAIERWGLEANDGDAAAIWFNGTTDTDVGRFLLVDGLYTELAVGRSHDALRLHNAAMVDLRNISGGGGNGSETGSLIRITQSWGNATYIFPAGARSHGIKMSMVYVGGNASYEHTVEDEVNSINIDEPFIPEWTQPVPFITIGSSGAPEFENTWTARHGGHRIASFFRDSDGFVVLQGGITGGLVGKRAYTLPPGYRPEAGLEFAVPSDGGIGLVTVTALGEVTPVSPSGTAYVSLDGIRFKATN